MKPRCGSDGSACSVSIALSIWARTDVIGRGGDDGGIGILSRLPQAPSSDDNAALNSTALLAARK